VFTSTSSETRSGYEAAYTIAIGPPSVSPITAVRSTPAASTTVRASSIHCSTVGSAFSGTGSEPPDPRLSKQTSRLNEASLPRYRASAGSSHVT
jgi:hypothetical protein